MDFTEKTIDELEARKAELGAEIEAASDVDAVNEKSAEIDSINAELEARAAAEAAKVEARAKVAEGEGNVIAEFKTEIKNEVRKMERNSVEYRNAWLKNLMGQELTAEERTGFTQAGATATNAIPTLVADKFFEKMKKLAPMLSEITLLHAAGNIQFVVEGTRDTVSAHTENTAISAASDTTVKVTLGAYEFFKAIAISESAKLMSIDAFENWIIEILAGDIARAVDNYIINGESNGIAAVTYTTNTNQILNTATTGYTYKNVCDLIALLPAAYDAEAKFLVNKKTLYGKIAAICDSQNRPIFVESPETGVGRIMGYPVVVDDYVSASNDGLYLGKWSDVVGNMSQDINVITYPDYDSGSVKFRGGAFFDSKVAKVDGIVRLVSTTG